ncbi:MULTISPECIES: SDR family NAD(P)-dependent oxidoreductase [unclassified Mesorhizobium]|jgi:3-oxoacyl-[acyl-carrier protein] reductase|uniref:SDR family NAD(P)-dependent oxidoreductase n=1 Tax=unclassified Mesorhizobium TaxID=325217 RepID=UPI0008E656AB|nr:MULTISPECIES: SDR family NAD(P)-dependent oxidoreductase [unclassified Mesorhizobium]RJG46065.1 SDR family oxidoreductase [Mesorhizobium sp. DCY119]SFU22840.1 3-oxoacyl-[acyl-carrier protein] reductase [Mesorhizobium sp. YR577]
MNLDFTASKVIVVGAAGAIGQAISLEFARSGATVLACDIASEALASLQEAAANLSGEISVATCDVTDEDAVNNLVSGFGDVDVLAYVAGGLHGAVSTPLEKVTTASWQAVVDINLLGAFFFCRAVTEGMKRAGKGRIIVISSGAGLRPSLTGIQSYCASKHGVVGFIKQIGLELGPFGITANSVAPGFILTGPDSRRQWENWDAEVQENFRSKLAGQRLGLPEDIANATLFFASAQAAWVTGQTLLVSGQP